MGKGKSKQNAHEPVQLSKESLEQLLTYLEKANPNNMMLASWSIGGGWNFTHGETRSASKITFHLGFRQDSHGHFITCIAVQPRGGSNTPVAGTQFDWGTEAPQPHQVLAHYQQAYGVRADYPYVDPNQRDNNNNGGNGGNGGGAGSSSGGGGAGPSKQVFKDDYGGYYYATEDEPYVACDAQGNSLGLLSVYIDASNKPYYYSRGKATRGTLTKDPRTQKSSFRDKEGRSRHFRYVGRESQYSRAAASRSRYAAAPSSSYYSQPSSSKYSQPSSSRKSSAPVYHTDPRSGKQYYVGQDGKTHWRS